MNTEEIISSGQLESYVLGLLSPEEAVQVESWAKASPEISSELTAIEDSLEQYAFAHAEPVSASVKTKLFESLPVKNSQQESNIPTSSIGSSISQETPIVKMSSTWKNIAAAAAVLLAVSLGFTYFYADKYAKATASLQQTQEDLRIKNEALALAGQKMEIVTNKYSKSVSLDGLPAAPDAAAKIFWMKNSGEVYIDASNLPAAPDSMQYQLWGIVDGKPVDGGMIAIDTKAGNAYNIQKMKTFGKVEAFAVTLETKGGNQQPKGSMFVLGKL